MALACAGVSLLLFFTLPMQVGTWWYIFPREAVAAAFLALALLPDLPRSAGMRGANVAIAAVAALPLTTLVTVPVLAEFGPPSPEGETGTAPKPREP